MNLDSWENSRSVNTQREGRKGVEGLGDLQMQMCYRPRGRKGGTRERGGEVSQPVWLVKPRSTNGTTGPKYMTHAPRKAELGSPWGENKTKQNTAISAIYSSCLFYQLLCSQKATLNLTAYLAGESCDP